MHLHYTDCICTFWSNVMPDSNAHHIFEMKSKVTERGQTTLPSKLREALNLEKGDEIVYSVTSDGQWLLSKLRNEGTDPAIASFLNFLSKDIYVHPEKVTTISKTLFESIQSNVEGVDFNLDEPLSEGDE